MGTVSGTGFPFSSYKFDPVLWSLGHRGPDAYLKDENGNPVPETVRKCDLKTARLFLELYHPKYAKDRKMDVRKMDVTHKTGVLVIGVPSIFRTSIFRSLPYLG